MKKILIVLLLCFVSVFGWGAEVIRYVDPDSAAGGDGTTWTLAYDSLSDWNTAEATDLVTATDWHHVYCRSSSGTADTTALVLSGWTTGTAYYVLIEAASTDRADADGWDTAKYRLEPTDAEAIEIAENYVRLKSLQLGAIYSSTQWLRTVYVYGQEASNDIRIERCRIRNTGDGYYYGIEINNANSIVKIFNTICDSCHFRGIQIGDATTVDVYNCTVYNVRYATGHGIKRDGGTVTVKNTVVFKTPDDFNGTITADYCATDDNDQGGNNVAESGGGADWPDDFEGAATGDFRLKSGSNLVGATTDQSSGLFTDDIEGTIRGASWDVGAFEYDAIQVTRSGIVIRLLASMWFTEALRFWVLAVLYSLLGWGIRRLHNEK